MDVIMHNTKVRALQNETQMRASILNTGCGRWGFEHEWMKSVSTHGWMTEWMRVEVGLSSIKLGGEKERKKGRERKRALTQGKAATCGV